MQGDKTSGSVLLDGHKYILKEINEGNLRQTSD